MDKNDFIKQCKYYKGEEENPFVTEDRLSAMWWDGEKSFYDKLGDNLNFFNKVGGLLQKSIENKDVSGILVDDSVAFEKRALIFYLDLWHSKWFPYDNLDVIYKY